MTRPMTLRPRTSRYRQRGLTVVEFMISVTIGLFIVAAIATLIASQSGSRAEVDRSGRMIENGRYALASMSDDLQLAGYWGELNGAPADSVLAAPLPDLCSLALADQTTLSQLHVQGYDNPAVADVPACVTDHQPGTDILVVRHAVPEAVAIGALTAGQLYIQTGLNVAGGNFEAVTAYSNPATNTATFTLKKKDKTTAAILRKGAVRIYYVARCNLEIAGGTCDGVANPVPTLTLLELSATGGAAAWSDPVPIAEGIENMQADYGVDTDLDGSPNGDDVSSVATPEEWKSVIAVKIHLLARSLEPSPGYQDEKTYNLGAGAPFTPASGPQKAFKRHVFVRSVRLVNPGARRQP